MSQADLIPSRGAQPAPTGIFPETSGLSRRLLLGGGAALAVAALPALASAGGDARFWALHRQWQAIDAEWEAAPYRGEEDWDSWSVTVSESFSAMFSEPVTTLAALAAKWQACDRGEEIYLDGGSTTLKVFTADLERLAARERWG